MFQKDFSVIVRSLVSNPVRTLGLILCIGFGIGVWGAMDMAFKSIPFTLENIYRQTRFADLEVRFLGDDLRNLPDLLQVPGVEAVEARLLLPATIDRPGKPPVTGLLVLTATPDPGVDGFVLKQGRTFLQDSNELVLERSLNVYHQFQVGDAVSFRVGEKVIAATVSGLAVSPEYFSMSSNPDLSIPEKGTLGVGFGSLSLFTKALGFTLVNDLAIRFDPSVPADTTRKAVLAKLSGLSIDKVMSKEDQFSHQQIMFNLGGYKLNGWALIIALILLSLFVSLLTYNRIMIENQKNIGNLVALGYSPRKLLSTWVLTSVILGLFGGLVAVVISLVQRYAIAESFGLILGMPYIDYTIDWDTVAVCLGVSVLISVVSSFLPMTLLLRKTPRKILVPDSGLVSDSTFLVEVSQPLLNRLPVASRYGIRNLLRRPGLAFSAILLIGFAISVAIAYGLTTTSYSTSMFRGLEQEKWSAVVDFTHPIFVEDLEEYRAWPGVGSSSPLFRGFVEAEQGSQSVDSRVLGINPDEGFRTTEVISGLPLASEAPDGVILSKDLSRDLGLKAGDTFTAHYQDLRTVLTVRGISGDLNLRQITMNLSKAQEVCGYDGRATGLYLNTTEDFHPLDHVGQEVAKISTYQQMSSSLQKVWDDALIIVYVALTFCSMMVVIFLAMFIMLSIAEREAEYATLRALGYNEKSIRRIVFSETFAQIGLAVLASFPMAILVTFYLINQLSATFFQVNFRGDFFDFVKAPVLALGIGLVVTHLGTRSILKKQIAPQLRSRDIG